MALRCDAGAEAALRVCVPLRGGNAEAGLRVRDAGAEAALRVLVPLHGNVQNKSIPQILASHWWTLMRHWK